jgi:hypothetical protein
MQVINLGFSIELEQQLDFDDDGLVLQTFVGEESEDDPAEVITPVDELIQDVIHQGKLSNDYRYLYCIAHELSRYSELSREAAMIMEDNIRSIGDLFDMDPEDLE